MGQKHENILRHSMDQALNSILFLANRPLVTRVAVALMFASSIWLVVSVFLSANHPAVPISTYIAIGIALLAYGVSWSPQIKDSIASSLVGGALVTYAMLVVMSRSGEYTSHYSVILALAIVSSYRNRAVMGIAVITAIIEQLNFGVFYQNSMFPLSLVDPKDWMLPHFIWVLVSGFVLMLTCEGGPAQAARLVPQNDLAAVPGGTTAMAAKDAAPAELSTTIMSLPKPAAKGDLQVQSMPQIDPASVPANMAELVKAASEVGARAQKLHRSISNIEGPLKRMVQSINGANRGMQEIKDELSKTAASVIQITQSSEMHANKANDVFQAADEAAYGSQIGALSTEQSIRNMDRIREQMDSIAQRMDNLLNKSQMMVQVVGFADELALQSKVLSVNAAIEAVKAGDRGQGFSAVAREVKSLANQSKAATGQVRQILKEIQKSIAEVRRSIAMGNETVDLASDQCRSTADSIKGLDGSVTSSRDAAEAILNSSKDQVAGIMQISHAMNDIQTVSEQNSSSLSNLQVEAQKLNTITKDLVNEMSGYQSVIEKLLAQCAALSQSDTGT